jgi:hypothetical protein
MANLQLMKAPEQMLCFARCDLFFAFNFHPSNSLTNVLVPVYPDSEEFTVEFTSDDWKYGGFGQIAHQTYPVKEFDGQRYVELYIPARTAIVLREKKEAPKVVVETAPVEEAPVVEEPKNTENPNMAGEAIAETAPADETPAAEKPKKTTRKKAVKAEGEEAPKKTTRRKTVKAEGEEAPKKTTRKKAEKPEGEEAPKKPRTRKTTKKAEE